MAPTDLSQTPGAGGRLSAAVDGADGTSEGDESRAIATGNARAGGDDDDAAGAAAHTGADGGADVRSYAELMEAAGECDAAAAVQERGVWAQGITVNSTYRAIVAIDLDGAPGCGSEGRIRGAIPFCIGANPTVKLDFRQLPTEIDS